MMDGDGVTHAMKLKVNVDHDIAIIDVHKSYFPDQGSSTNICVLISPFGYVLLVGMFNVLWSLCL
jgi:hypothetical protein